MHTADKGGYTSKEPYKAPRYSYDGDSAKDFSDPGDRGVTTQTSAGLKHAAGNSYSGKRYRTGAAGDLTDRKQGSTIRLPAGGKLGGSRNSRIGEATGDPKFDGMMGKISNNTSPQTAGGAASAKVGASANQHPDDETIRALNKMMYDMHVTMQAANKLMQKLTRGR
jgi:hypothetical protein